MLACYRQHGSDHCEAVVKQRLEQHDRRITELGGVAKGSIPRKLTSDDDDKVRVDEIVCQEMAENIAATKATHVHKVTATTATTTTSTTTIVTTTTTSFTVLQSCGYDDDADGFCYTVLIRPRGGGQEVRQDPRAVHVVDRVGFPSVVPSYVR